MTIPIEEFKNRLKYAMDLSNMKPIELSQKAEIPKSSISQYMSGYAKPNSERVYKIGLALNVSEAWLLGYDVPMERTSTASLSPTNEVAILPKNIQSYNPVIHTIPVLGYISAGLPLYANEHIQGYTYTDRNGGAEYFALRVKGDSMNALQINDGNIIIVRKQSFVENGEIAVVRVGSEDATVKCYRKDGDTVYLIPKSLNPIHEIQVYDLKKTKIDVIGKVVECKIEF